MNKNFALMVFGVKRNVMTEINTLFAYAVAGL
jgi:hypothetical protein